MSDSTETKSKNQIDVNLSAVNVDLSPLAELEGVFNNLINTIARGCGRLYAPWERMLNAKADRVVALGNADKEIELVKKFGELVDQISAVAAKLQQPSSEILMRAHSRFIDDIQRKQENREAVVVEMLNSLAARPPLQDTTVNMDADWVDDFFGIAENIGNSEIRAFWGKLLANEVTSPGTTSRQTLHVLRSISSKTAQKFSHFCRVSMVSEDSCFFLHPNVHAFQTGGLLTEFGITLDDLLDFESTGLIRSAETLMVSHGSVEGKRYVIDLGGKLAEVKWAGIQAHSIFFTIAGREIRNALQLEPLQIYADALVTKYGDGLAFRWKEKLA